ncbi:amino acid ABC transporter permease [Cumulibacter soli]|uniref:amino acid ABC transporter permease n=1 Tax=Cumulibacter soli TaxID=2546344 RepID=UPI001067263A|nr:amino acid ABC transporter permease [Cumulibacter soli]
MNDVLLNGNQYKLLIEASWVTVQLLLYSFAFGCVLALILAIARMSDIKWIRGIALVIVEFARGISSIILLFIIAIAIPYLSGIKQPPLMLLATIALGINMGGYGAEIIRGAIQSVSPGQTEAAISLNLSPLQRLRYVILPQAMRVILPPMGNLTIEILKGTALVSLVGVADIMQMSNNIRQQQLATGIGTLPMLLLNVLVLYFLIAQIINAIFRVAEWRVERRMRGNPALTDEEAAEAMTKLGLEPAR